MTTTAPAAEYQPAVKEYQNRQDNQSTRSGVNDNTEGVSRPRYQFQAGGYEYSKEELNIKYQSKDGDSFELSYRSENVKAFFAETSGIGEARDGSLGDFLQRIKDFIREQEKKLLDTIFNNDGTFKNTIDSINRSMTSQGASVPEYWNAENTSQRIVDFATSFYQGSGLDAKEFGDKIVQAVKQGFEDANRILGNLPGAAGELASNTQELTMEKLDNWIAENTRGDFALAA